MRSLPIGLAAALAFAAAPALADTYTQADFSGHISPGNANVKPPFAGNGFTQGDPISGHFVYDDQLVPSSGSGFVNVPMTAFPDIANIPDVDAFSLTIDSLTLTAGDNLTSNGPVMIQYNNGQFQGFVFTGDFAFQNVFYQLQIQGSAISVLNLDGVPNASDPHGFPVCCSSLLNGSLFTGNGNLTGATPYTPASGPQPGVPEPSTWSLLLLGFAVLGGALRRGRPALTRA